MTDYEIKRVARSRSIKIRVEPNGKVVVTAPKYAPKFIIDRFVKSNANWIQRNQKKTALVRDVFPVFDWDKKIVSYLGKLYNIKVKIQDSRFKISDHTISIAPITGLEADAKKMLVSWLKREGEREITERTINWAQKMNTSYRGIRFRQQKSRWGSCTRDNRLSFNWRLIHFKPEIINYVVIHELAHTLHHDHSETFWGKVAEFDPDYKQQVQFLKKQILTII